MKGVSKVLAATIALTVVTMNGRAQDAPPADAPSLRNGRQFLEPRLEYNEDVFGRSVEEVRSFLREMLGG